MERKVSRYLARAITDQLCEQGDPPTLLMGDVGDPNVPLLNSYEWYHALRDAGVEVEFFAYPVDSHFPKDVVRTTDVYRRWVSWMNKHLK